MLNRKYGLFIREESTNSTMTADVIWIFFIHTQRDPPDESAILPYKKCEVITGYVD